MSHGRSRQAQAAAGVAALMHSRCCACLSGARKHTGELEAKGVRARPLPLHKRASMPGLCPHTKRCPCQA
eukprot:scaffold44709_cov24-Tisochrysis_lutea.AAC.1